MVTGLKEWKFGMTNDYLVELVLSGKKKATTSVYNGEVPKIGEESIILFENNEQACVIKIIKTIVIEFKNITEDLALLEGEGSFEEWKEMHVKFLSSYYPQFDENTKVLFEIFEVTRNLVEERLLKNNE